MADGDTTVRYFACSTASGGLAGRAKKRTAAIPAAVLCLVASTVKL